MATYSSVLAWRIPQMVEPGGLPSMGLHRVGHDWSDLAAAAATLEPISFPRILESFSWKLVYEINIWVLSLLKCYKVVIAPSLPQQTEVGNICTHKYIYISIFVYLHIYGVILSSWVHTSCSNPTHKFFLVWKIWLLLSTIYLFYQRIK